MVEIKDTITSAIDKMIKSFIVWFVKICNMFWIWDVLILFNQLQTNICEF